MKSFRSIVLLLSIYSIAIACTFAIPIGSTGNMDNLVAHMEIKEPIKGLCDDKNVFVILPLENNGQVKAKAPKTREELTKTLNSEVRFLRGKSDYEDKGMVRLIINCRGKLVKCEIDNKTQNPKLDKEIVAVFAKMQRWKPGRINDKAVDTGELYSFTIKKGKISLES